MPLIFIFKTEFDITLLYQLSYTPHIRDPKVPLVVTYATLPGDLAGEDGTRTHNFRLGMLIKIAVYAFIYLIIYYINFFS